MSCRELGGDALRSASTARPLEKNVGRHDSAEALANKQKSVVVGAPRSRETYIAAKRRSLHHGLRAQGHMVFIATACVAISVWKLCTNHLPHRGGRGHEPYNSSPVLMVGNTEDRCEKKAARSLAKDMIEDLTLAEVGRRLLREDGRARSIRKRAGEIAMLGRYVGWFEWLIWAHLHAYRPTILLASNEIELWEVFGAGLPKPAFKKQVLVAGVYTSGLAHMAATHFPLCLNHWMVGDKSKKPKIGHGAWAKSAHVQAAKAGWRLRETAAQGDCGIDTMAFWENRPRTEATWYEIRQEIAATMVSVAMEAAWQDAFVACQESRQGGAAARAASALAATKPICGAASGSDAAAKPNAPASTTHGSRRQPSTAAASGQATGSAVSDLLQPPAPASGAPPVPKVATAGDGSGRMQAVVKLEPPGEVPAAKAAAALAMGLHAVGSGVDGTRPPGVKGEPAWDAMSPSKPVPLLALADDVRVDGEVEIHGGPLALARPCVDEPRTPVTEALRVGSAGAFVANAPRATSLNGQKLEEAFIKWIWQQSEDKQKAIVRNYDSMKAQEEQWLANIGVQEASKLERRPVKKRVATSLHDRLQLGNAYRAWRAAAGATSRAPLKDASALLGGGGLCNAFSRLGPTSIVGFSRFLGFRTLAGVEQHGVQRPAHIVVNTVVHTQLGEWRGQACQTCVFLSVSRPRLWTRTAPQLSPALGCVPSWPRRPLHESPWVELLPKREQLHSVRNGGNVDCKGRNLSNSYRLGFEACNCCRFHS